MKVARFKQTLRRLALVVAWLALPPVLYALQDVHVVALFKDRVMVEIDGKRHTLRTGETSPEGVTLVSADSAGAVFSYRGETLKRRLDNRARAPAATAASGVVVRIYRDTHGMFMTTGSINGLPVSFLVDTGASAVATTGTSKAAATPTVSPLVKPPSRMSFSLGMMVPPQNVCFLTTH